MSHAEQSPLVVVIGPLGDTGGMSTAMRLQLAGPLAERFELTAFDNSKRTAPDRPLWRGIYSQLRMMRELWGMLRCKRPAIVHIHTCSGMTFHRSMFDALAARLFGARVVLHIHGGRFASFLAHLWLPTRMLVRRTLVGADRVIVLGERWARVLRHFDPRIALSLVRNGVVVPAQEEVSVSERPTIVCVGNLSRNKGLEMLIEAVAGLPQPLRQQLEVRVIGSDPEDRRKELEDLVRVLGMERNVHFLGQQAPEHVQKELARAWVFALPSRAEALPIALLEAMAQGLPCVATRVGAVPELIRHRREGLLVGPGDVARFRESLRALLEDDHLRARIGQAARCRIETEFSEARVSDGLAGVYELTIVGGSLA